MNARSKVDDVSFLHPSLQVSNFYWPLTSPDLVYRHREYKDERRALPSAHRPVSEPIPDVEEFAIRNKPFVRLDTKCRLFSIEKKSQDHCAELPYANISRLSLNFCYCLANLDFRLTRQVNSLGPRKIVFSV